jgi:hypothetical protein
VAVTGKFAYVTNAGSNNVSAYTINATIGVLTPVAGSLVAGSPLAVVRATPTPEPGTVWCSTRTPVNGPSGPEVPEDRAERNLCNGQFMLARTQFASIVPVVFKNYDSGWFNIARGYFYSLIASNDNARARNFLTRLETYDGPWQPPISDRLIWSNNPKAAFAAYATEATNENSKLPDPPVKGLMNVRNAAQAMSAGDVEGAIADLQDPKLFQQPSYGCGPCTVYSLQLLMLGNAYEVQRRWPEAFATWVRAADFGHAVPEYDFFDNWNFSALEMIYYYRAHKP